MSGVGMVPLPPRQPRLKGGATQEWRLHGVDCMHLPGRGVTAMPSAPTARIPLDRRLDVLVVAEQVSWVVLVLQSHQLLVIRPITRLDPDCPFLRFLPQAVDVFAAARERLYRLRQPACPADVTLRCPGVEPDGDNDQEILRIPVAEGGLIVWATAHRPVLLKKYRRGQWRRDLCEVGRQDVDDVAANLLHP